MTVLTIVARAVRNVSFAALLAALALVVAQRRVEAFSCTPTPNYSNHTLWYWACEFQSSDPCSIQIGSICDYDCYTYFQSQYSATVYSCQSSEMGDGHWWLSWAECGCYVP
jgi:hypothetical protein